MKTIKTKQATEASIFGELERVCRIITDQAVDGQDVAFFRQQIGIGLKRIDALREAKEEKQEAQKKQRALKKQLDEIDSEIVRLARIPGTANMISRMQQEKENCLAQIQAKEKNGVRRIS